MARQQFAAEVIPVANCKHLSNGTSAPITTPSMMSIDLGRLKSDSPANSTTAISNVAAANTTLAAKTLREQQAVLSLQALAQQDKTSEKVHGTSIADLTDKLILGAGEDVVGLAERDERGQLEGLQKLIERRLSILRGSGRRNAVKAEETHATPNGKTNTILVNGKPNPYRANSGTPRGISKSKAKSTSKSRERRAISRGRK